MSNSKSNQYKVSLIDKTNVVEDKKAKSLSFFCTINPVLVDEKIISELKEVSKFHNNANVRICLHSSPDAEQHDMIILEKKDSYYRPHKHNQVGETFHMIEGEMGVFSFDDNGNVYDSVFLKRSYVYRIAKGSYHAILPISDYVIYHENRKGPFLGNNDSIFPAWSPSKENMNEIKSFIKTHKEMLDTNKSQT